MWCGYVVALDYGVSIELFLLWCIDLLCSCLQEIKVVAGLAFVLRQDDLKRIFLMENERGVLVCSWFICVLTFSVYCSYLDKAFEQVKWKGNKNFFPLSLLMYTLLVTCHMRLVIWHTAFLLHQDPMISLIYHWWPFFKLYQNTKIHSS